MYQLPDLLHLMARLRDPQHGCPWDLQQDYASIVPHTLEEAYEVADAIESGDFEHLPGELGDLLFQVVHYSQLAGRRALRLRHGGRCHYPQAGAPTPACLFRMVTCTARRNCRGSTRRRSSGAGRRSRPRSAEKTAAPEQLSLLDDVPSALPALSRAAKLQKRAAQVGFDWPRRCRWSTRCAKNWTKCWRR